MKNSVVLLAIYMLFLALLPCGDSIECADKEQNTISVSDPGHSGHDNHTENCSPFCICACCGQFLNVSPAYGFTIKLNTSVSELKISYQDPYFDFVPNTIWQPPQLI